MQERWYRKSFLSFLKEAPEDILAVRDREGRDRNLPPKPQRPNIAKAAQTLRRASSPKAIGDDSRLQKALEPKEYKRISAEDDIGGTPGLPKRVSPGVVGDLLG